MCYPVGHIPEASTKEMVKELIGEEYYYQDPSSRGHDTTGTALTPAARTRAYFCFYHLKSGYGLNER